LIESLYLATAPECLDHLSEIQSRFFRPGIEGRQVLGILGKGQPYRFVDHIRDGPIAHGRLHAKRPVNLGLEIDRGPLRNCHGCDHNVLASKRQGASNPAAGDGRDRTSVPRKLSELQGDDPLILTLARGHYCPKEHQQHLQLAAFYPQVAVAYTQIVTISTDDHHTLQEFRASVGAQWTFLSDPERTIQRDREIQEYTDPEHDPMIPHTLVLKPGLVIHSIYNGYWFWGRPSVEDLRRDLRAVTREVRPDWDLSAPGLRDAWDAGDLSHFHGWNKRGRK
jgi:peroxiredoxin